MIFFEKITIKRPIQKIYSIFYFPQKIPKSEMKGRKNVIHGGKMGEVFY